MADCRIHARNVVGAFVALALTASAASRGAEVQVQLGHDEIYLGTQTTLHVQVRDSQRVSWPTVEPVTGLDIEPAGGPSVSRDLFRGTVTRTYRFAVRPVQAGTFTITNVKVDVGDESVEKGPFTLVVREAEFEFLEITLEPDNVLPGQSARLQVAFQGYRPNDAPIVPAVKGLTIRSVSQPRVRLSRQTGKPYMLYTYDVRSGSVGDYVIDDITVAGVKADSVTVHVAEFLVEGVRIEEPALKVGESTTMHVFVRGLQGDETLSPPAVSNLEIQRSPRQRTARDADAVFSYTVKATAPGTATITQLTLDDGRLVRLPEPARFSIQQAGDAGLLAFGASTRSEESLLGEPFVIDFELFYRGQLIGAALDLSDTQFADKPYISIEPVDDVLYENWEGRPVQIRFGSQASMIALAGAGTFQGQQEQMLRFALRVRPMAVGKIDLSGMRAVIALRISERKVTGNSFFSSTRTEQFDAVASIEPHQVIDPRGTDAPPGYRGAVGTEFRFETMLDRTSATAMSPLKLTMRIAGPTVSSEFEPPALADVKELTRDFDVSSNVTGGEFENNTITFEQIIRPRHAEVDELPALPLVYYDYEAGRYETVYSLPIPLEVRQGGVVGADRMEAKGDLTPQTSEPEETAPAADEPVLGANYDTLGTVKPEPIMTPYMMILVLASGPVLVVGLLISQRVLERQKPVSEQRKLRKAELNRLEQMATGQMESSTPAEPIRQYMHLKWDVPESALSPARAAQLLEEKGFAPDDRGRIGDILEECDRSAFTGQSIEPAELQSMAREARSILIKLERKA